MYDYFSIKFTFLYYLHGDLVVPGVIVVAGIVGFMCGCRNRCTTKPIATAAVCIFSSIAGFIFIHAWRTIRTCVCRIEGLMINIFLTTETAFSWIFKTITQFKFAFWRNRDNRNTELRWKFKRKISKQIAKSIA